METPTILTSTATAVPGVPEPVEAALPVATPVNSQPGSAAAISQPAASATLAAGQPVSATAVLPELSPGHQSSEFYLALVIVAGILAALWDGKLDPALASALLGLIVSGYPSLRTWLKSQHVDAVAAVLAAQGGRGGVVLGTLAGVLDEGDGKNGTEGRNGNNDAAVGAMGGGARSSQSPPRGSGGLSLPGVLGVLGATLLLLASCAQSPYYVSGINGTVDASKDGSRVTGGGVGITISPNPYYPLPKEKGLSK